MPNIETPAAPRNTEEQLVGAGIIACAIILAAVIHAFIVSSGDGHVQRIEVKVMPDNVSFNRP